MTGARLLFIFAFLSTCLTGCASSSLMKVHESATVAYRAEKLLDDGLFDWSKKVQLKCKADFPNLPGETENPAQTACKAEHRRIRERPVRALDVLHEVRRAFDVSLAILKETDEDPAALADEIGKLAKAVVDVIAAFRDANAPIPKGLQ